MCVCAGGAAGGGARVARVHALQGEPRAAAVLRTDPLHGALRALRGALRHVRLLLQPLAGAARRRRALHAAGTPHTQHTQRTQRTRDTRNT